MRFAATLALTALAVVVLVPSAGAAPGEPWATAADLREALSEAETDLILGGDAADASLERARLAAGVVLAGRAKDLTAATTALDSARGAVASGNERAFAGARAAVWTTVLHAAFGNATVAARRGDVRSARQWLLVREFRPPTRFSRAAADGTLALDRLAAGALRPAQAAKAVAADLLDTYDGRLRSSLDAVRTSAAAGFDVRQAEASSSAL